MKVYKSRKIKRKTPNKTSKQRSVHSGRPKKQETFLIKKTKICDILENPMSVYNHDNYPKLIKLIFLYVSHSNNKYDLWVAKNQKFTSLKKDCIISKKPQFKDEKTKILFNLLTIVFQKTQNSLMLSEKIFEFFYTIMKIFCCKYECNDTTTIFNELEKKFLEDNLLFFKNSNDQKDFIKKIIDICFSWTFLFDME